MLLFHNCTRSVLNMHSYSKGRFLFEPENVTQTLITSFLAALSTSIKVTFVQLHLYEDLLPFYSGLLKWNRPELLLRTCRQVIQFAINMSALSARPAQSISNSLCSQPAPPQIHAHREEHRGIKE